MKKREVERVPPTEALELHPNRRMNILNEVCVKEKKYYDIWQAKDQIVTGGYLGNKYKINNPSKQAYLTDKVTDVTPQQPWKVQ